MSAVNGKPDALERVGIVGGGIMGTGIAEVCAKTGLDLILVEVNEAVAETARARVQHSLDLPSAATSSAPRRPRRRSPA